MPEYWRRGEEKNFDHLHGLCKNENKDFELHNRGQPLLQQHDIMIMTFQIHMVETIT